MLPWAIDHIIYREEGKDLIKRGWEGPLLGSSDSFAGIEPFFFDPFSMIAAGEAFGPGISLTGSSGSGKTYASTTLAINMILEGASGTIIDPKSELGKLRALDGYIGEVTELDITRGDGTSGMLDPFLIEKMKGGDIGDVSKKVMAVLALVLGPKDYDSFRTSINSTLEEYLKISGPSPSFSKYITFLNNTNESSPAYKTRADYTSMLTMLSKSGHSGLIFGEASPRVKEKIAKLSSVKPGVKIITTLGLDLPKEGIGTSDDQRVSQAILFLVCDIIFSAMSNVQNKKRPKFLFIDEAWMLLQDQQIATLVSQSIRLGRALNYTTILVSQNASELERGGVANNVGACFIFKANNDENTSSSIKMLGEGTGITADEIKSLERGQCFVRDGIRRVGRIDIVQTNNEIAKLIDSNALQGVKV